MTAPLRVVIADDHPVGAGAKPLAGLGLPDVVGELALKPRGLVLVTGPTDSGNDHTRVDG